MKLRTKLPTKFLTEESPFIGLSYEVGYHRLAVVVGETIVFTLSNMIRSDIDSEVWLCPPAKYFWPAFGGLPYPHVRTAHTPYWRSKVMPPKAEVLFDIEADMEANALYQSVNGVWVDTGTRRGFLQYLESAGRDFFAKSQLARKAYKASGKFPTREQMDRMQDPLAIYQKASSMGSFTTAMMQKRLCDMSMEEYYTHKLHNNGRSGIPVKSSHDSLTSLARRPKFIMTSTNGRGVIPYVFDYAIDQACRKVGLHLKDKYYYTGEGMLPKDN